MTSLPDVYGINRRNVELVYAHNPRKHFPIADNKQLCKQHLASFEIPVPETLAVCRGLFEVDTTIEQLRQASHFVVKPASGSGGEGILVVGDRTAHGHALSGGRTLTEKALRGHLANTVFGAYSNQLEDVAIVERRLLPHRFFRELWSDGVSDLRIITLEGTPIMAMIRVPTRRSGGKANLHQGGIGVAVDLESGMTTRARAGSTELTHHPEVGIGLLGLEVPEFAKALQVARATAACVPLGYLGVDLVIDEVLGPLVLEINARPGLEIQNIAGQGLGAAIARRGR